MSNKDDMSIIDCYINNRNPELYIYASHETVKLCRSYFNVLCGK